MPTEPLPVRTLPTGRMPTPDMLAHIEAVTARARNGLSPSWIPRRLILHNYWLYAYQEFHLTDGHLVLRGQNGAGKSTVLTTGITLALDGDKTPGRMDTFGTGSKSVGDYLVGTKDAQPGDPNYAMDRTAYIALEFRYGSEDRYRTIGLGVRADRNTSTGQPKIASWYFVIRDGRRVGPRHEIQFSRQEGPNEIMLSQRELEDLLGSANFVDRNQGEYQKEVNNELFGFPTLDGFNYLMQMLIELRSPKLNKDLKPTDACETLSRALPPVSPQLLARVSRLLDDIDSTQAAVKETSEHLGWVSEIDRALANAFRTRAQLRAVDLLDHVATLTAVEQELVAALAAQDSSRAMLERIREARETLEGEAADHRGALRVLRNHEAYKGRERLARAIADGAHAEAEAARAVRLLQQTERDRNQRATLVESLIAERSERVREASFVAHEAADIGRDAHWSAAVAILAAIPAQVDALTESDLPPRLDLATLRDLARERKAALEVVRLAWRARAEARRANEQARTTVRTRTDEMTAADTVRGNAIAERDRVRAAAAEAVRRWVRSSKGFDVPAESAEEAASAVARIVTPEESVADALRPLTSYVDEVRNRLSEGRAQATIALEAARTRLADATVALDAWEAGERTAAPAPRPGQELLRSLLATEGVRHAPLFAACDLAPGVTPEDGAQLEAALADAGLLDALIVDHVGIGRVSALAQAGPDEQGDRWIRPAPVEGKTLADLLVPAPSAVPEDDVVQALRSVALTPGDGGLWITTSGAWGAGALEGRSVRSRAGAPDFLGETNRRLTWERRREELRRAVDQARDALGAAEVRLEEATERRDVAAREADRLTNAAELRAVPAALFTVRTADQGLERARDALARAAADEEKTRALVSAREAELAASYEPVTDAREAKDDDQLTQMIGGIDSTLTAASRLVTELTRVTEYVDRIERARIQLAEDQDRLIAAASDADGKRRRAAELQSEADIMKALLDDQGLENLLQQERGREARVLAIQEELTALADQNGSAKTQLTQAEAQAITKDGERAEKAEAVRAAEIALRAATSAYPSLAADRERFDAESPLAAATALLARRADDADTRRRVERGLSDEETTLSNVFSEHRARLSGYSPEMVNGDDGRYVLFRRVPGETGALTPAGLKASLDAQHGLHVATVREKEEELFQEFVFGDISNAIRGAIQEASKANEHVNRLLEERRFSDRSIALRWEPRRLRSSDRRGADETDYTEIVALLQRSPFTLLPDQQEKVKAFFRERVAAVRAAEREGRGEMLFHEALQEVLDYRRWFRYTIVVTKHGSRPYELTNDRYNRDSGAEKALNVFFPLLAAADARYRDARADAPKILAMDEAFSGVDAANRDATLEFMSDLGLSWMMTSEKVWGASPSIRGASTYQFIRKDNVAAVSLHVWDGKTKVIDDVTRAPDVDPGTLLAVANSVTGVA